MANGKRVLLIVSGGIAAYKSLELVRLLRARETDVRPILTAGGGQFITPLSLAALCEAKVHQELFDLTDESEMGHIRLSREADLVVVAPASADILAKMRAGLADDLASTVLLATDKPVMVAPAMNHRMWSHPATVENLAQLEARGVRVIGPEVGAMACGEYGPGRMADPEAIARAIQSQLSARRGLAGKRALVTSGPTYEALDPVRYMANHSSGRQGHAVARAVAEQGAETILVSGPTNLSDPPGVRVVRVSTAEEMFAACQASLPADIVICAAAVTDWRIAHPAPGKIKKNGAPPVLELVENPDILAHLSKPGKHRARLVVGFAAETGCLIERPKAKRKQKGSDWMVANDVSPGSGVFGGACNTVHLIDANGEEDWPTMSKEEIGRRLAQRIAAYLEKSG